MDKEFKQFVTQVKGIKLSQKEKEISRARIFQSMKLHPIQERNTLLTKNKKFTVISASLILSLLLGGSVSYAAESALPGDTLYSVKITINEGVKSTLALSVESKAKLQVDFASKRLKEAEELAAEDRLNIETQTQVELQFKSHTEKAQKFVMRIEEEDDSMHIAEEVHGNLQSMLNAHEDVLVRIKDKSEKEEKNRALTSLILNVRAQGEVASTTSIKLQTSREAQTNERLQKGVEEKKKSAQNKVDEIEKLVSAKELSMSDETKIQVNTRLVSAREAIITGNAYLEEGIYLKAFGAYQNAYKLAQEAKFIAEIEKELRVSREQRAKSKDSNRSASKQREENNQSDKNWDDNEQKSKGRTQSEMNASTDGEVRIEIKTEEKSESMDDEDKDSGKSNDGEDV